MAIKSISASNQISNDAIRGSHNRIDLRWFRSTEYNQVKVLLHPPHPTPHPHPNSTRKLSGKELDKMWLMVPSSISKPLPGVIELCPLGPTRIMKNAWEIYSATFCHPDKIFLTTVLWLTFRLLRQIIPNILFLQLIQDFRFYWIWFQKIAFIRRGFR